MRSIWLVVKHDISATLRQKSFWILTFLMPAVLLAINAYSMFAIDRANTPETGGNSSQAASEPSGPGALSSIGLVDEGAFLKNTPHDSYPSFRGISVESPFMFSNRANLIGVISFPHHFSAVSGEKLRE